MNFTRHIDMARDRGGEIAQFANSIWSIPGRPSSDHYYQWNAWLKSLNPPSEWERLLRQLHDEWEAAERAIHAINGGGAWTII